MMRRRIEREKPPLKRAPRLERQLAFRLGVSAETRAAMWLMAKGYRVVARRWKSPVGEIDLVVRRGRLLVFVEVKARPYADLAAEAVTGRQRHRIVAAAKAWLARHPRDHDRDIRFDAVLVSPWRLPRHLEAAFDTTGLS